MVKPLLRGVIPDDRGRLMEILRNDDPSLRASSPTYMTTTIPE